METLNNPITQWEKPDVIMERKHGNEWDVPDCYADKILTMDKYLLAYRVLSSVWPEDIGYV
jgi:hypothetical protein